MLLVAERVLLVDWEKMRSTSASQVRKQQDLIRANKGA